MAGRSPVTTPLEDLRRLQEAARLAHREDEHVGPVHSAFLEFGPYRWLVVPLGGLAFAAFVFVVGLLVGLQQP